MCFAQTIETSQSSANKCHVVRGKSFQYVFASYTIDQITRINRTQKHNRIRITDQPHNSPIFHSID